jgi:hypothetical protein
LPVGGVTDTPRRRIVGLQSGTHAPEIAQSMLIRQQAMAVAQA